MQTYDFDLGLERKTKQITSKGNVALLVCNHGTSMTQQTRIHPDEMKDFKNIFQKSCEYLKLRAAANKELSMKDAMSCKCSVSTFKGEFK